MSESIEERLKKDSYCVQTTVGMSMYPMLRNRRDRVVIRPVGKERLGRWDLPLYRRPDGKYVLHRIIGVKDGYYVIRGDNTYVKEQVPDEWILGVMTEFYRGERHMRANQKSYRLYAAAWQTIYPIRYCLYALRRFASRIKHRIFK
ncbi:MAG: S24/S26 family peptidase [Clostridia bacterium]|nr:S24/S26 family peptidase [Clostridia bacterium]